MGPTATATASPSDERGRRRDPEEVVAELTGDVLSVLDGGRPSVAVGSGMMRLAPFVSDPWVSHGTGDRPYEPLVEALGLAGMTSLLPAQEVDGVPGLQWALNDVPMSATAMADVHEQRAWPDAWPRFSSQVAPASARGKKFGDAVRVEAPVD